MARVIVGAHAVEYKAPRAPGHSRQIHSACIGGAKHHVHPAGICAATYVGIAGTDHQIHQSIAIDIASWCETVPTLVASAFAIDDQAPCTGGHGAQMNLTRTGLAKNNRAAPS